jgi:heme-degrading monooxygenase HmoA
MHARVSFYDASPDNVDAGIEQFSGVQASVQQMQGNQGGMLLIDREGGKAITITFWDSADDLQATSEQADQLRQQVASTAGLTIRSGRGLRGRGQFRSLEGSGRPNRRSVCMGCDLEIEHDSSVARR